MLKYSNCLLIGVCSIIGASTIAIGFYAVMWAQAQEENTTSEKDKQTYDLPSSSSAPLLL